MKPGGSGRGATRGLVATGLVAAALLGGCDEQRSDAPERTCTGAQAISATNLYGMSLPARTLSLSFDDGPGARTAELSAYLKAEGIRAAFFVNGKMLAGGTAILAQLVADGHVVANHTESHRSLTGRATGTAPLAAAEVVSELRLTDELIAPFTGGRSLFRAPFGDFDADTAAAIAPSPMNKYVGPVSWEIGDHMGPDQAADWDCWVPGTDGAVLTPEACGDLYEKQIDAVGRGIVLLHDPYFIDDAPERGGTVDMVKRLVPILKAKGYAFARIDEVPDIAALLPPPPVEVDAGPLDASASSVPEASEAPHVASPTESARPPGPAPDPCARATPRSR